ncbi:MAG: single-stranded-DNA-specific exonuclease RecJ [Candidatus Omnitrophota bacterium]|nr:single-stranded-DNA-specific exonuclease RecJ [Candidatus Omnitrophota bacterium]
MSPLAAETELSPILLKLLAKRGFTDPAAISRFLDAGLDTLHDPMAMYGMREAVARVQKACENREQILIHGDYDADGITGSAIVMRTLEELGASARVFLPNRKEDGYGVSERAIRDAHANGVTLLVTVDCGITAHRQIELARNLGIDTIILDHHKIPSQGQPNATVVLNPLQEACAYPFKELSAGGLAYKLSQALLGTKAHELLDLTAISTVCDVAPLIDENRVLVREGLKKISAAKNTGIAALLEVSNIRSRSLNASHLGFVLGPRINAAGRMSSPEFALRLLITDHEREAASLAAVLNEENKVRQREERQVVKDAIREVERSVNFNRDRVLIIAGQGWHPGVIGIVASRLVDRYHRPAVVISIQDGVGKGSGRSVRGFNLFRALETCKDILPEFGGHEQAAGLTIPEAKIPLLRKRVNEFVRDVMEWNETARTFEADLDIRLEDFTTTFVQELELLEPHGAGNARPLFRTTDLQLHTAPTLSRYQTIQFYVTGGGVCLEAVWPDRYWTPEMREDPKGCLGLKKGSACDLCYSVKRKERSGEDYLILEVREIRPRRP